MNLLIQKADIHWKSGSGAKTPDTEPTGAKSCSPLQEAPADNKPGELIATFHAGIFSPALANELRLRVLRWTTSSIIALGQRGIAG